MRTFGLVLLVSGCFLEGGAQMSGRASVRPTSLPQQCRGDMGQSASARQFGAFVTATNAFIETANDVDARLQSICNSMGSDLQMAPADLTANGSGTLAICSQVAERLKGEIDAARAEAKVETRLVTVEPVCVEKIDEYKQCIERCEPRVVRPGRVDYVCEGGELRGSCSGQCSGHCAANVDGQCSGSCEGTCSGSCSGGCYGSCEGECTQKDASGRCVGQCKGICRGTCSGGCSGRCTGRCVVSASASCGGECRGGCSVEWREPVCTGHIVPPEVNLECRQMCDTVQVSHQECTPGEVRLEVDARAAQQAAQRIDRAATIVAKHLPQIHAIGHRLTALKDAGEIMVDNVGGFARALGTLGANAMLCSAQAAAELPRAVGQVSVAFQVSVKLTASVDVNSSID